MQWPVSNSYDGDILAATANSSQVRLISVPQVGTQEAQNDFNGQWERCSAQTVSSFSAVGYRFGLQLQQALGVPVGLIDNAWGGSPAEAWVRRDILESDKRYSELIENWNKTAREYDIEKETANFQAKLKTWTANGERANAPELPAIRSPATIAPLTSTMASSIQQLDTESKAPFGTKANRTQAAPTNTATSFPL